MILVAVPRSTRLDIAVGLAALATNPGAHPTTDSRSKGAKSNQHLIAKCSRNQDIWTLINMDKR